MLTVKDLLQLESFKNFKLISNDKGLDNIVLSAGVLDFEYIDDVNNENHLFEKNSFVISSLLFAKDSPDRLLPAIQQLVNDGISGLAFKQIIYENLPSEVMTYVNSVGMPVFAFAENDAFFEDVIFEIMSAVKQDGDLSYQEQQVKQLQEKSKTDYVDLSDVQEIWSGNDTQIITAYLELSRSVIYTTIKTLMVSNQNEDIFICKYNSGVIISMASASNDIENALYQYISSYIEENEIKHISFSDIKESKNQFLKSIDEAAAANIVANIQSKKRTCYSEIGLFKVIIPEIKSKYIQEYMHLYIDKITENKTDDLLKTAIAYVQAHGDMSKASELLFCHKNTIRYRINKIRDLIDPNSSDQDFYRDLSFAINIYLVNDYFKNLI